MMSQASGPNPISRVLHSVVFLVAFLGGCSSSTTTVEPNQPLAVALGGAGSGTVTSTPAGISCTSTNGQQAGSCSASFDPGAAVTLTATAAGGSGFNGWSGACNGSGTCALTMSSPRSVTGAFAIVTQTLTVAGSGNGTGTVTSSPAGIVCDVTGGQGSGQCSAAFPAGTVVTLRATVTANSSLAGWTGACLGTGTCSVTLDAAKAVTATFALMSYPVTVSGGGTGTGTITSNPAGISCSIVNGSTSGTCNASFSSGTNVVLTAAPSSNSDFAGWSGFCTGTAPCALQVTGARTVSATVNLKSYALTLTGSGTGNGTVTSSPAGISCNLSSGTATGACTANFAAGTQVSLTPSAGNGSAFGGWTGACSGSGTCQVAMDGAKSATAAFNAVVVTHAVTVAGAGTGSGTVTSSPAGLSCTITNGAAGGTCSASFAQGTTVTLTAIAAPGSNAFGGWSGSCSGTGTCALTVDAAKNVTATFNTVINTQLLTVSGGGTGSGSVTSSPSGISCSISSGVAFGACAVSFPQNAVVTLSVTPTGGSTFTGWSNACTGTGSCVVTLDADKGVTASFAAPPPAFAISPDFAVVAPGANRTLTANLTPVTLTSRNTGIASVSGLTVTGVAQGVTDVVGTNGGSTDSSRIAVTPLDGFGLIASSAQDRAFMDVSSGANITLDIWLIRPSGGTQDLGSIQGTFTWDPARFQYISMQTSSGALSDGWSVTVNPANTASGSVSYAAFSASGTAGTFSLARLTLRAIGSSSGAYSAVTPAVSAAGSSLGSNILGKIVPVLSAIRIQ
jgi:hypothetical protein